MTNPTYIQGIFGTQLYKDISTVTSFEPQVIEEARRKAAMLEKQTGEEPDVGGFWFGSIPLKTNLLLMEEIRLTTWDV